LLAIPFGGAGRETVDSVMKLQQVAGAKCASEIDNRGKPLRELDGKWLRHSERLWLGVRANIRQRGVRELEPVRRVLLDASRDAIAHEDE
jgi:hypothetical protein